MNESVFALLDDRNATSQSPSSRLYGGYAHERRCTDPAALDALWAEVEADQRDGLHALLLIDYEWGSKLLGAGRRPEDARAALRVLMFRTFERLSSEQAAAWLARQEASEEPAAAGVLDVQASVDRAAFHDAIGRIHAAIRDGETYQVNYTYRLQFAAHGTPIALYRRLRARQPVPFGAFVALPRDRDDADAVTHVLSCSPELFVRHADGKLVAKPMKGTAPREHVMEGDSETARLLSLDAKNRAENLMIVDLLRNDLGRVARTGSVTVPALFDIESHRTVFQMTSTVEAELKPEITLPDLLRAVFPCGSITGAPKHHTMDLIAGLEGTPRGLYTGAIGWVDAPPSGRAAGAACGDFCLSVAIRTLTLGAERDDGLRHGRLGIGAGIVLDSQAEDEYRECRLKARFLTGLDPGFTLFETMHATREHGVRHRARHLARLESSARTLDFDWDAEQLNAAIERALDGLPAQTAMRLRLALHHDGRIATTAAPLTPLRGPATVLLAPEPLPHARPMAGHKTTLRAAYDAGIAAAEASGAIDSLFFSAD